MTIPVDDLKKRLLGTIKVLQFRLQPYFVEKFFLHKKT